MEKYGFVYIWYDRKRKMFYVGAHWGSEDDGYVCSSNWMMNTYKRRPQDFKRRILERVYSNKKDTFNAEHYWLKLIKSEELKDRYYNQVNVGCSRWLGDEEKKLSANKKISNTLKAYFVNNPEAVEKLRLNSTGSNNANFGVPRSEDFKTKLSQHHKDDPDWGKWSVGIKRNDETKLKMSEAQKGRDVEEKTRDKISASLKSYYTATPQSKETKAKRSEKMKGRIFTEEHKTKLSKAASERKLTEEVKQKISETKSKAPAKRIYFDKSRNKYLVQYQHKTIGRFPTEEAAEFALNSHIQGLLS